MTTYTDPRIPAEYLDAIPYELVSDDSGYHTAIDHDGHLAEDCGDCDECAAALESIRTALPPGWNADWTGNGNGTESDVTIYPAEDADA